VEIVIPPRSPYVGVVRLVLSALARDTGLDDSSVEDLKIAVSEACANAVLASEEAGSDDPVTITWDKGDGELAVLVEDHADNPPDDSALGFDSWGFSSRLVMSMSLLQSLVDECEITNMAGGGTSTRLVVRRQKGTQAVI
jgi:serine/threonine-protein kinase RsbW